MLRCSSCSSVVACVALPTALLSGLALWKLYHRMKQVEKTTLESRVQAEAICKVLFFPDEATAHSLSSALKLPVDTMEEGSLFVLMSTLQTARKSLDVCVFTISCKELGDVLINAHHNGLIVRVISDNEQLLASGSQIERLRRAGIQVRNDSTSYFMHHKFTVIDDQVLVNGSLNWTLQGICGNQENVVITNNAEMVNPFCKQFEQLWEKYDPELLHES